MVSKTNLNQWENFDIKFPKQNSEKDERISDSIQFRSNFRENSWWRRIFQFHSRSVMNIFYYICYYITMRTLSYCRQKDSYTFRKNLFNFDKLNYRTRPNMRSPSKVNQNSKVNRRESWSWQNHIKSSSISLFIW